MITAYEAEQLLIYQLTKEFLPACKRIPHWMDMSTGQQAALLSFAYNNGANFYDSHGFSTITAMLKNRSWVSIPNALLRYRNPNTTHELGLARRRFAEGLVWKGADPQVAYDAVMRLELHDIFEA